MDNYTFRYEVQYSDLISIKNILSESGFFNDSEIDIAVSLIQEKLEDIRESSYQFIFLEDEFGVIGYTCYGYIDGTKSSYDLYWIAVDPNYKREGYGTLLLKKAETLIRSKKGSHIYIETSSTSLYEPTRLFYENNGYKKEAVLKNFYNEGDDKIIFSKRI